MPLKEVLVVSHTHWDREWYRTEEVFRQRLVRLIDELLDAPPEGDASFLLDGQAILLDDYLGVRPERAAELSTLLRAGSLEAGPWYVLADNLIPSGEAIVRNLQHGIRTVGRLRGTFPRVLYCPDSFGHPAILPDIAAGFGMPLIVLWRGLSSESDIAAWTGQTGARVLAYHLPPDGYEFGSNLPISNAATAHRWETIRGVMSDRSNTDVALLLNGADHHARQTDLADALIALREAALPVRVHAVSLATAAERIFEAAARGAQPQLSGELRNSHGYTWTLQGTLGSRAYQKRDNAKIERTLVRDVEPWVAQAAFARAATTDIRLLDAAWRTVLSAHPHDTLCGTATDDVAQAFDARIASAGRQANALRASVVYSLLAHDAESARNAQDQWQPAVVLRNAAPRPRGGIVELLLTQKVADIAVGPGSASRQGVAGKRVPWVVDGIPIQVLEENETIQLTESARAYPDADRILQARAVGWISEMPGYSLETRAMKMKTPVDVPNPVVCTDRSLDNGHLRVELGDDLKVTLFDRATNRTIVDLLSFENHLDVGDLYTPAIRKTIRPLRARRVRLLHRGPIRGALSIEFQTYGSSRKNADFCTLTLQLDADTRHLAVHIEGMNRSENHRLRIRFATGLKKPRTFADAAFFPLERDAIRVPPAAEEHEAVVPTAPLHRWVAHTDHTSTIAVFSDGLAEYESMASGHLCITLVRAVGELSSPNLPERPGHAGWPTPTPAAQLQGRFRARFAISLFGEPYDRIAQAIEHRADDVLLPISGETLRSNQLPPRQAAGLELQGAGLAFSSAAPAQTPGWISLRCINRSSNEIAGRWILATPVREARRVRLDEAPAESTCQVNENEIVFIAQPREIITILAR